MTIKARKLCMYLLETRTQPTAPQQSPIAPTETHRDVPRAVERQLSILHRQPVVWPPHHHHQPTVHAVYARRALQKRLERRPPLPFMRRDGPRSRQPPTDPGVAPSYSCSQRAPLSEGCGIPVCKRNEREARHGPLLMLRCFDILMTGT